MSKKNIAEFYEKTILSSFIAEPWTFAEHRHRLKSNHFLNFGFLIDTLDQLYGTEKPFDVEVIESKTSSRDIQALYDIVSTPAVANVLHYIDELKEYRRKGELLEVARTLATDDGSSSEQILFKLEELLEQKDVTLEARHKNFDEWAEYYKDMPPLPRYPTGVSFLDFLLSGGVEMGQLMLISGAAEAGKAQPLYSKVLTPKGYEYFWSLKEGMEVIGSDGKAHKILGVYDRGVKDVYRVSFDDGSEVECCDEHLWTVTKQKSHGFEKMTLSLKEIMQDYITPYHDLKNEKVYQRHLYSVEAVSPVVFAPIVRGSIHPYVMGALLGDGGLSGSQVMFSNPEDSIIEAMNGYLESTDVMVHTKNGCDWRIKSKNYSGKKTFTCKELIAHGLMGKKSKEKFIPQCYLRSSIEDRFLLLQGLLDTDGNACGKYAEFSTTSTMLALDIKSLVLSLGGKATITRKKTTWVHKEVRKHGIAFRVNVSLPDSSQLFLHSIHKKQACKPRTNAFKRWITNIEYVGKEPVRCIKVDAEDSLYVTDGYILTHNTSMGIQILKNVSKVAPVVFFSFEFTVRHFVEAQKFIEPKYKNSNMTIINEGMDLESLSANIRLHAKNGVRFFLIDSQMRVEVEKARNSEEEESKKFSTMAKLAHKYDLFILFIIQTSKTDPNSPIGSKKGSHESSITIHIEHVPVPKGDEENSKNPWVPTKRIVEVKKNKQTGKHYKEEVAFNPQNREFFMIHESHKQNVPVTVIYDEKPRKMEVPRL